MMVISDISVPPNFRKINIKDSSFCHLVASHLVKTIQFYLKTNFFIFLIETSRKIFLSVNCLQIFR